MSIYNDYRNTEEIDIDTNALNNAIKNILLTRKGSLPGKPTFGSDIYKIVFSQLDSVTESILERYIREPLRDWEPRIRIISIKIQEVPEYNRLNATIHYSYRDNGLVVNDSITINLRN